MIIFIKTTPIFILSTILLLNCGGNKVDDATEEYQVNEKLDHTVEDEKISIISETYESKSDDGTISAKIEYPQIEGMNNKGLQSQINKKIKTVLDIENAIPEGIENDFEDLPQEMKGYSKEGSFTTGIANSNIISFSAYQSEFMAGAAHPTDFVRGYNMNPQTGEFYSIQDFIVPTKMEAFNTLLLGEIENGECGVKGNFEYEEEMCKFNPEMHSFNFTDQGMEIHLEGCFPHVARICNEIVIPFAKIKELSIKNSPIAKFVE